MAKVSVSIAFGRPPHLWSAVLSHCSYLEPTYRSYPVTMRLEDHQSSWPTESLGARRQSPCGCGSQEYAAAVAHLRVCAIPAQGTPISLTSLHQARCGDWRVALEHPRPPTQKGF